MTFVAGLSVGVPAFIGDLLVSWRIPSDVDLPTQREEGARPGTGTDHAAGLAQKLVVVRPYLMLASAGQRAEVDRMIRELDNLLPSEAHPHHMPNQERADGLIARAIMLRFAARAIVLQWIVGIGLGDSWGGGWRHALLTSGAKAEGRFGKQDFVSSPKTTNTAARPESD